MSDKKQIYLLLVVMLPLIIRFSIGCRVSNILQDCYVYEGYSKCSLMSREITGGNIRIYLPPEIIEDRESPSLRDGVLTFKLKNIYRLGDYFILKDVINPNCMINNFTIYYTLDKRFYPVKDTDFLFPKQIKIRDNRVSVFVPNSTKPVTVIFAFRKAHVYDNPVVAISVFVISIILYLYVRKRGKGSGDAVSEKKPRNIHHILTMLTPEEETIIKMVFKNPGITQREIREKTGFSAPKLTRIISELEQRGLITRDYYGRTRKIYLSENIEFKEK